ncbi:MAG: PIG-L deacetylase family protein [Armatimonadota bacterium]|nr:PIG-L deacetylase family protein [Armatimonadota bacterium]MDR7439716.1 PIG-L deacetylase family protein [Armatimonadota bacterium]MDR7602449.1 PIG-L deacetylase family protein [Armatimonadota bacterium]
MGRDVDGFWVDQRVLVIAPHPDDEAYGCGGTIAKVKASGGEVFVIVGSVGDLRHYSSEHPIVRGTERAEELCRAMDVLEVDGYEILFEDTHRHMRLDAVPRRDLVTLLEREARYSIDRVRPTVVILPHPGYNQDHEALFRAGFAACRPHLPEDKPFVRLVLSCDAPQLCWSPVPFHPNFYVDISEFLEVKLRALACHASQLRPAPHHGSLANVERLARVRGSEISVEAAEAFVCHRMVL